MKVSSVIKETPSVITLTLRPDGREPFPFRAGQTVELSFVDLPELKSHYALSCASGSGFLEVTVKRSGLLAARLSTVRVGDRVLVDGPFGNWVFDGGERESVFVCGGTGISPIRAMFQEGLKLKLRPKMSLFYSARTVADIIYAKELAAWQSQGWVTVYITLTRVDAGSWTGATGRLSAVTFAQAGIDFSAACFYLCGPKGFVTDLETGLLDAGVPRDRVRHP